MNEIIISNIDPQNIVIGEGGTTGITTVYVNGVDVTVGNVAYVVVPTKTSELQNDSGYITQEQDPTVPYYVKQIKLSDITNWNNKQNQLVSGQNIKTINDQSLLGSGNINVDTSYTAGTGIQITDENVINNTITSYNDLSNTPDLSIYATLDTKELLNYFTKDYFFKILPKLTGTGSNISLSPTVEGTPLYLSLGATQLTQDGTPTPSSPQDIHTISGSNKVVVNGSNLFDESTMKPKTSINASGVAESYDYAGGSELYIPVLPSTEYTFNCSSAYQLRVNKYTADKTHIERISKGNATYFTFTTDATCYYIRLSFYAGSTIVTQELLDNLQFWLEKTNQATTYTPYVSQEADIDLHSKQLFDKTTILENSLISSTGAINTSTGSFVSDYIFLKGGTTYYNNTRGYSNAGFYDLNKTFIERADLNQNTTYTPSNDCYVRLNGKMENIDTYMLNEGSTALPYETYYDYGFVGSIGNYENKPIRTSGKNILDISNSNMKYQSNGNVVKTENNVSITLQGADSNFGIYLIGNITDYIGKTLTFSLKENGGTFNNCRFINCDGSGENRTNLGEVMGATTSLTFTVPSNTYSQDYLAIRIYASGTAGNTYIAKEPMINEGSTALPYEPYGSNEWYIKKNIGKVVLDGSSDEDWAKMYSAVYNHKMLFNITTVSHENTNYQNVKSNLFSAIQGYTEYYPQGINCTYSKTKLVLILDDTLLANYEVADLQALLSTTNLIAYIVLENPTYTQITGTLANQLEYVYQKMQSQKGQTNISQVNNDLAFTITATTLKDLSSY